MSDTSVVFNVLARDRASRVFRSIAKSAQSSSAAIVATLGLDLVPVLASATAGAVGLGAALGGAGAAVGVFGAVTKTAFTEMQEASQKSDDLREKIRLLTEQARVAEKTGLADAGTIEKARNKALSELQARYNLMPPALRKVTMAYDGMKTSWKDFVDANKPATYAAMTGGFNTLSTIIPKLQPLFDTGAAAAQRFTGWLSRAADGGGIDRLVTFLNGQAGPALDNLATIGRNMGVTLGAAFRSTAPAGQGVLAWLTQLSERVAAFAQGGGFQRFMGYVSRQGPAVVSTLGNIASAATNIARAVTPLAPISLAVAGALTAILAAIPPPVLTTLIGLWVAYAAAMKGYQAYVLLAGVATKVWTAAQWLLNVAMNANPVGLIIIAVVALIAIIVLLWKKCAWFRNFWIATWNVIKTAAVATWNWIKAKALAFWNWSIRAAAGIRNRFVASWNAIKSGAGAAWNWIKNKILAFHMWVTSLPGKVSSKLSHMWTGLWTGFKAVVNKVVGAWNNLSFTIGGGSILGVNIPSLTLGTPDLPMLAKGGDVRRSGSAIVGERGPELVSLSRGAQVTPLTGGGRGGGEVRVVLDIGAGADSEFGRLLLKVLRAQPATTAGVRRRLGVA